MSWGPRSHLKHVFFQLEVQKKMVISYRFCFAVTLQKQLGAGAIRNSFQGENMRSSVILSPNEKLLGCRKWARRRFV
jgi:hypothetical protein